MFFEDLSNPKYISDKVDWMFPYVNNFYGSLESTNIKNNYVSRKLIASKIQNNLLIEVPSSFNNLSNCIEVEFIYGKNSKVVKANPVSIRKGNTDYYSMQVPTDIINSKDVIYYKVSVSCDIRSIKIYGL